MASLNNTLNSTINGLFSPAEGKKITLIGSHFKNPLFVAPIVVNAICAACFLAFTVYSWLRREKEVRKAFLVMMTLLVGMTLSAIASSPYSFKKRTFRGFMTSLLLILRVRSFMRSFADGMVHEYTPTVSVAFLILPAFKPVLVDLPDVTLIGVAFRIIKNRNRWLTRNLVGHKNWQRIHSLALTLLILFAVADIGLYIYAQVLIFTKLINYPKLSNAVRYYKYIHITYMTMYFVTSVDILVCAVLLMFRKWRQDRRSRIITLLATIVAPALLLRSTALLAAAIRYSFLDYSASRTAGVVTTALWGLPSVVIFTGLLLIQFTPGWFTEEPVDTPTAPAEEVWPGPGTGSNLSSPQMQNQPQKPWVTHQVTSF